MSDNKTIATNALDTLGTIIDDTQKRDAIHLAVEPVIAGCKLFPGEHVVVYNGVARQSEKGLSIGIVDPFLDESVQPGERFWLVVHPRTIQSLRHVWSHPSLPDETIASAPDSSPDKTTSELWLRAFCEGSDCPAYATVMELIDKGELPPVFDDYTTGSEYTEESLHFVGSDAHGKIPPEFWTHAEIVLGRKLEWRPSYFSCSC